MNAASTDPFVHLDKPHSTLRKTRYSTPKASGNSKYDKFSPFDYEIYCYSFIQMNSDSFMLFLVAREATLLDVQNEILIVEWREARQISFYFASRVGANERISFEDRRTRRRSIKGGGA